MEGEGAGSESAVEAKPRSETAMEGEGAGSESTMEAKATTECKPTTESTVEAKPRSETAMEGEGAGSESTVEEAKPRSETAMEAKATTESNPTTESTVEANATSAKTAPAEADCGKAVTARVRDTEASRAGNGRRSQRRAGCRNRQGSQTNRYLVHHDARSFF